MVLGGPTKLIAEAIHTAHSKIEGNNLYLKSLLGTEAGILTTSAGLDLMPPSERCILNAVQKV